MLSRRRFLQRTAGTLALTSATGWGIRARADEAGTASAIAAPLPDDDVFSYLQRTRGAFDRTSYARILGAANEFKEGDELIHVAATDEASRRHARQMLARTRLGEIGRHPLLDDELGRLIATTTDARLARRMTDWPLGQLKEFLLTADEPVIKGIMPGLSSEVIGCVVKLMSNAELIEVGRKVFNPLPGSRIGAKGYLGARIQPNSPTDNVDDIRWQVLDGWSYAVGDVLLGTNPVSSDPQSVLAVERTLQDLLATFQVKHLLPHCVLAHVDVQAEVEENSPGSTALWFQSIAGSDTANATFDITIQGMREYAARRTGPFGLYFETGQGADFTNGHGHGFDMVLHEARKYGFARALRNDVAKARQQAGHAAEPWVHLNDVAGFIGPEVFRTREQLVRCCLEDIVMGKLHGLCLGLDVCSTLHMDVSLDDLDWCLEQILPANPAYLMALPTKIDPMLGYLTTGYQDHVRLREKFGYRVNDAMWQFFQTLQVIDERGRPTPHFGDPLHVYVQYQRRRDDDRPEADIREEGRRQLQQVRQRGVFIAEGYGSAPGELTESLKTEIRRVYDDARVCLWTELPQEFINDVPHVLPLSTRSTDRTDYILHPESGEQLHAESLALLRELRREQAGGINVQIVVSDGLNSLAISDDGHLHAFLQRLHEQLDRAGFQTAQRHLLLTSGRVRAGYRIGEALFGGLPERRAILHVIGERPGTGHHTFSVYMTSPTGDVWNQPGVVDHNITRVISGIAVTALPPQSGADEVVRVLQIMSRQS